MGADAGPLFGADSVCTPEDILQRSVDRANAPPNRFLYVVYDSSPDDVHYFMDLDSPTEPGDCAVVRMRFAKDAWLALLGPCYLSFREMLFVSAMENVHLPSFPHRAEYVTPVGGKPPEDPPTVERVTSVFERLGFVRLPYPRHCLLFERRDAAIRLYRPVTPPGFSFVVGMRDPRDLQRFMEVVEDSTGMHRWRATTLTPPA
jgi:hypothetical protein